MFDPAGCDNLAAARKIAGVSEAIHEVGNVLYLLLTAVA